MSENQMLWLRAVYTKYQEVEINEKKPFSLL